MNNDMMPTQNGSGTSPFDSIRHVDESGEYWTLRDLAKALEYASDLTNFIGVVNKAKQACFKSGKEVNDHFVDYKEMVDIGSGAKRPRKNIKLTRYACYLIVQNGDPTTKPIVAIGQTYFAIQTRLQELSDVKTESSRRIELRKEIAEHNKRLAGVVKAVGVIQPVDYAIFQNHGYEGLYNGLTMGDIHKRKGLKKGQHILDHMGSTELAANFFRVTQTEEKIRRDKIQGKAQANEAHKFVGRTIRKTIVDIGGAMPENLPAVEDVKKIGRKIVKAKQIEKT